MPEKRVLRRSLRAKRQGKAATTQAGEFIREEMRHIRKGVHGARSTKQAIAIGLAKARRAGVELPPPPRGKVSERTRRSAQRAYAVGHGAPLRSHSTRRSAVMMRVMKREGHAAASHAALARQARSAAARRTSAERSAAAEKAARTKGPRERSAAARKAARTRLHSR